jgi:hypothetical protein
LKRIKQRRTQVGNDNGVTKKQGFGCDDGSVNTHKPPDPDILVRAALRTLPDFRMMIQDLSIS